MMVDRERPYAQFNYLVDFGDGTHAGFQEISAVSTGKSPEITLKRGIIAAHDSDLDAPRTVMIRLQNESHTEVAQVWQLTRARIVKHSVRHLGSLDTDVEELILAYESLSAVKP